MSQFCELHLQTALMLGHLFQRTTFFFFYQSILCQQTESAGWWLPPWPASDFSKCAIVQSELCFIDLFHGRRKITSGLLPVRNNNGVLFCCLYFLGQTSVVKIFYHSCVERVGGFSVEMVLRTGFWSAHQEIIQPFSDSFVALVHWGEIRWFTWLVKVKKSLCGYEKNPGNVSPTVQKEHFLCVLFCLKELSGFMEILFSLNLLVGLSSFSFYVVTVATFMAGKRWSACSKKSLKTTVHPTLCRVSD